MNGRLLKSFTKWRGMKVVLEYIRTETRGKGKCGIYHMCMK
jgi:hypothetical protein